jgi:hypothetical protein
MDNEQTLVEAIALGMVNHTRAKSGLPPIIWGGMFEGDIARFTSLARAILPIAMNHAAGIAEGHPSPFVGAGGWDKQDEGFLAAKEDIATAIRAAGEPA